MTSILPSWVVGSVLLVFMIPGSLLAQTVVDFGYTGAAQTFTVPTGVTSLSVVANGAQGGTSTYFTGGFGGRVSATLTVLPDAILYIYVGGAGGDPVGVPSGGFYSGGGGYNGGGAGGGSYYYSGGIPYYNGGGGGGGGTDIRIESGSLSSRLLVAGGGGGKSSGADGGGGGLTGGAGGNSGGGGGGGGGTSSGGGLGATGAAGTSGTTGQGGNGPYYGGGGGGGYYGGGGGGNGSGGGGGSSYTDPTLASAVVHTQGANTGNGSLQIIYTTNQPPANTAPTVANTIPPQSATVGQAFTYVIPANTFTDAETPGTLTLSASGLPAGLSFTPPATISGTPTTSGGSSVTVVATDPGSLSVSTSFSFTVNTAPVVTQTITISNSTPNQICGSKGTSVVVNFTTTGTYATDFQIKLVKIARNGCNSPQETIIQTVSTSLSTATLTLPQLLDPNVPAGCGSIAYKIVVQNGSVSSVDYPVTILALPTPGTITVQGASTVTTPGQTIHLTTPATTTSSKTWYSHSETQYWQTGTLLSGETGDNIDVIPTTSTYYSVVYTDNSTLCSNRSARVRVPFTITLAGTVADGVYNEGRGVQLDAGSTYGGTQGPLPLYFVPTPNDAPDADAKVYSTLFGLYTSPTTGYFIRRKNDIWEIYYGAATYGGYGPFGYTRLYHTQNPFPTLNSGGRVGLRAPAAITGTRPPEDAVWIKDADNSTLTLHLSGVSEANAPMPVVLTEFTATLTSNKQVALNWVTTSEQSSDYFSVERSVDLKTFETIARVKAKENSTQRIAYSLTDETPLTGLSYYRLKQVDLDGTPHTYPAVPIRTEGTDALYPNPSNGTFVNLDVAATSTIELLTLTGKSLPFARKKVSESSVQLVPQTALMPGIYLISVNGITRKWVVQ